MAFEEYWNNVILKYSNSKPEYDNWLDKYNINFKELKTPVLDLGCGAGADTRYLVEKNCKVIALDYATQALDEIKKYFIDVKTVLSDISKPLPFLDNSFDLIIADLSLHYFDDKTTKEIMIELQRILTSSGVLIARVNSVDDINYGAQGGTKIEENYYFVNGYNKRFFTLESAVNYFSLIGNPLVRNEDMIGRYSKPKKVIEVFVKKSN